MKIESVIKRSQSDRGILVKREVIIMDRFDKNLLKMIKNKEKKRKKKKRILTRKLAQN
jgi:hypothetical protein